jgi:hypothetical protein
MTKALLAIAVSLLPGTAWAAVTHDKLWSYEACLVSMQLTEQRLGIKGRPVSHGPGRMMVVDYYAQDGIVTITCGPNGDIWIATP